MRPVVKCSLMFWALTLVGIAGVFAQRAQLATLRARCDALRAQEQRLPEANGADRNSSPVSKPETAGEAGSSELLQLRNQVSQLNRRLRELGNVQLEQARLQAQLLKRGTNSYVKKSEARNAGYATPADTIQTFLWSIHQRDVGALLECFTPEVAAALKQAAEQGGRSSDFFMGEAQAVVGLMITSQETLPDGSMAIQAEVAPGIPPATLRLQNVNGQWKLANPP